MGSAWFCAFCFVSPPTLLLELNCCLRLVGLSFLSLPPLYFLLHSAVDRQCFSRVVYVFEALAKLIQSRGGALWLGLSLQEQPTARWLALPLCNQVEQKFARSRCESRPPTKHTPLSPSALGRLDRRENTLTNARVLRTGRIIRTGYPTGNMVGGQIFPEATCGTVRRKKKKNPMVLFQQF